MRAGKLDTKIALQRKGTSYSSSGSPVETWSTLVERWSDPVPVQGDERNAAQQWIAREQVQFTIRWSQEVDDLSPLDRVICPATATGTSPLSARSIYEVIAVHQPDRHQTVTIMTARRAA